MKVPVIDLEELANDIRVWGLDVDMAYDEDEEAYVLHVGEYISRGKNQGLRELTIAPGFNCIANGQADNIYAYANNINVHHTEADNTSSSSRSYIIAHSRLNFRVRNNSFMITLAGIQESQKSTRKYA